MAKKKRTNTFYPDVAVSQHREEQRENSDKAQRSAGWYSDDAYMREVSKEGIKSQQRKMAEEAGDYQLTKDFAKRRLGSKKGRKAKSAKKAKAAK